MNPAIRSIDGICAVEVLRGSGAEAAARPDLLLEVPHGATRAADFRALRSRLAGDVPADLIDFFFVNTDVGAPELARAIAAEVVRLAPHRTALVLRSRLPRTLVDCNRRLDAASVPRGSSAGQPTPGLPPWIRDAADQHLLLAQHAEYRAVAEAAYAEVCGAGGTGLMVHTYAPRSIDVSIDDRIVERLHAAYERIETWPLRAEIDLITEDPEGRELADPALAVRAAEQLAATGRQVEHNGVYALHPATLAHAFATAWPGRTLCFEVRRDLLVRDFVPFTELEVDGGMVSAIAAPFARALTPS